MTEYLVSWSERVFYEASFETDAEEWSEVWWDIVWERLNPVDSNGMDDLNSEVIGNV